MQAEARDRQRQQGQEHVGQRLGGERAGIGQCVGQRAIAALPTKHRVQVGHVGVDVRRQYGDFARLQRRIETLVLQ